MVDRIVLLDARPRIYVQLFVLEMEIVNGKWKLECICFVSLAVLSAAVSTRGDRRLYMYI